MVVFPLHQPRVDSYDCNWGRRLHKEADTDDQGADMMFWRAKLERAVYTRMIRHGQ